MVINYFPKVGALRPSTRCASQLQRAEASTGHIGKSGARLQRAMDCCQRLVPLGDKHQRQSADSGIEIFGFQIECTGVHQLRLNVAKALLLAAPFK